MIKRTAVAASLTLFLSGFPVCAQEIRPTIRPEVALGAQVPNGAATIDAQIDLINAAIEAALETPSAPPPLSAAEISEIASAVRACWNVGSLSRSA